MWRCSDDQKSYGCDAYGLYAFFGLLPSGAPFGGKRYRGSGKGNRGGFREGDGRRNTERKKYAFYNEQDKLLFYITFVGNRNLIIVNVDGISTVYQGK